jgi:hypothetical protein
VPRTEPPVVSAEKAAPRARWSRAAEPSRGHRRSHSFREVSCSAWPIAPPAGWTRPDHVGRRRSPASEQGRAVPYRRVVGNSCDVRAPHLMPAVSGPRLSDLQRRTTLREIGGSALPVRRRPIVGELRPVVPARDAVGCSASICQISSGSPRTCALMGCSHRSHSVGGVHGTALIMPRHRQGERRLLVEPFDRVTPSRCSSR